MPRCRRSCLTFWTSCPRRGGYQPPAGACYAPLQTWGGDWRRHGKPAPPPCPAGRSRLIFFPFRGGAGTGPAFPTAPHPVGAAVSRPRAHAMRPYKRGVGAGGSMAHRYRPLIRRGGPVLFSSPFVGNAGTGLAFSTAPHPAGAADSRPRAHAMRPCKCRGGGWRRHGTPIPPLSIPQNTAHHVSQRGAPLDSAALGAARRRTL